MKIARMELRDEHLAEDYVSDALAQAYERRAGFRGDSSLRTWLTTILKNRIIDLLRKQWREQPLESESCSEDEFDPLFDDGGHWVQKPSDIPDPVNYANKARFWTPCRIASSGCRNGSARSLSCERCSAAIRGKSVTTLA